MPIIAGGTGLYIESLKTTIMRLKMKQITDEESEVVDKKLAELDQLSNAALHQYLHHLIVSLQKIFIPIIEKECAEAIQYYLKTKKFLSSRKKVQQYTENYDTLLLGIDNVA